MPDAPQPHIGRPTALTEDVARTITGVVAKGNYVETAAAVAGVPIKTVRHWMLIGRKALREHGTVDACPEDLRSAAAFSASLEKALGIAEMRDLEVVDKAAQGGAPLGHRVRTRRTYTQTLPGIGAVPVVEETESEQTSSAAPVWQAAAWRLERRHPKRWGRKQDLTVKGDKKRPLIPMAQVRQMLAEAGADDD
jgi:hypothetical protein